MDWKFAYEAYAVNNNMIWLNNCGTVPAGNHVLAAVQAYLEGYAARGHLTDVAVYADVNRRIKAILAELINCDAEELVLIHNTAEGMNFISHGLDLKAGDEIILLENEYPSNVYPWWHWREKGVRLVTVAMADTPRQFFENLLQKVTARTCLMALSAVHWCTGMPLPLNDIGELCRQKGIAWVVDGAQGVGMQPLDVKAAHITAMAFSAWKWLMGPLGLGVMYVARKTLERLRPIFMGTSSVSHDQAYLPYKETLKGDADRFIVSTPNFTDWIYFQAALAFLQKAGFARVRKRLFDLSHHLQQGLDGAGFEVLAGRFSDHPTAIVVAEKPGVATADILAELNRHQVAAAERLGRLRLAAHIYNSPAQLDQVIDILAHIRA